MADTRKPVNILILTYWSYADALIQTYTLPYVRIIREYLPPGSQIHLLTIEQKPLTEEQLAATRASLAAEGVTWLNIRYQRFGLRMAFRLVFTFISLWFLLIRKRFYRIHTWCTPAGGLGWFLSMVTGIPLVLDSFEPQADPMVETGTWAPNGMKFKILHWLEKQQAVRAKVIYCANKDMPDYALRRYGVDIRKHAKVFTKPACVDLKLFGPEKVKMPARMAELGVGDRIVCVYAGKFGGMYYRKETFDFFKVCYDYWQGNFCVVILTPHTREELDDYCRQSNLDPACVISRFVPHSLVPEYLGVGDFGISPFVPTPARRYGTPIKTGEYWALGLPVVIPPNISDDSDNIDRLNIGAVIRENTQAGYLEAVRKIDSLLSTTTPAERYAKIRKVAETYRSFDSIRPGYAEVYGVELK